MRNYTRHIWELLGRDKLNGIHLHNTRGQGLANVMAALEVGLTTIDASMAGIGGCPFAPGASGNIVTEDLAFMLDSMGLRTGIDLDRLLLVVGTCRRGILVNAGVKMNTRTLVGGNDGSAGGTVFVRAWTYASFYAVVRRRY